MLKQAELRFKHLPKRVFRECAKTAVADRQKCISCSLLLANLRTTTMTLSTTTGSELQCTAQARPVNFVVVVSSTTPNKVKSRRSAIHKLRQV